MRAVADTNTVVSTFLWGGVPAEVLAAARAQRLTLFTSAALTFALRGERQPWGAEDTAFVFRETFKAPPTDAQKAYDAILGYAQAAGRPFSPERSAIPQRNGQPSARRGPA